MVRLVKSKEVTDLFEIFDTEVYLASFSYLLIKNNNVCLVNVSYLRGTLQKDLTCIDSFSIPNKLVKNHYL